MRKFIATLAFVLVIVAAAYAATVQMGALKLDGSSSGSLTVKAPAAAGSNTLTLPAGTTDFSGTGGTSQVVKQTSSGGALTVGRLACADLSDSGAGCAGSPTVTDELCVVWDSSTAVIAATMSFPIPWTTYTITGVKSAVNGGGSFSANVKIASTSVTSCSAISVSGTNNTDTTCTAANTGSADDIINVVITSPSGTVNQAYVCPVLTHTVN